MSTYNFLVRDSFEVSLNLFHKYSSQAVILTREEILRPRLMPIIYILSRNSVYIAVYLILVEQLCRNFCADIKNSKLVTALLLLLLLHLLEKIYPYERLNFKHKFLDKTFYR